MPTLSLIRHAPTLWNEQGRMQGRADIPLSDFGFSVAENWTLPDDIRHAHWHSSPLQRATKTANLLGVNPILEDSLIEMDWGAWEGETLNDLRKNYSAAMVYQELLGLDFCPSGGESPRMVQDRILPWLKSLAPIQFPVAAVTHKGVIRAVTALATGWDMIGKDPHKIEPNTCRQFHISESGEIRLLEPSISLVED
jgi:broad specificity phosphatase PhoE